MFKLEKSLYSLKQAPRSWYQRLSRILLDNNFTMRNVDNTLFMKTQDSYLLIVQNLFDDIMFESANYFLCKQIF